MIPSLALHYRWTSGTLPPPYFYTYTIDLNGVEGVVHFSADYAQHQPPCWSAAFTCAPGAISNLYEIMRRRRAFRRRWVPVDEMRVGGPLHALKIERDGRVFRIPIHRSRIDEANLAPLFAAIRDLVPQPIWAEFMARREEQIRALE